MVTCVLRCDQNKALSNYTREVIFHAVYTDAQGNRVNQEFATATPWAELRMHVTNPAAFEQFVVGRFYNLDFTPR